MHTHVQPGTAWHLEDEPAHATSREALLLVVAAWLAFIGLYLLGHARLGPDLLPLAVVPVLATAWWYGSAAGMFGALATWPLGALLVAVLGDPPGPGGLLLDFLPSTLALVFVGHVVGRIREQRERDRAEAREFSRRAAIAETIARTAGDAAWAVDRRYRFILANEAFQRELLPLHGGAWAPGVVSVDLLPPEERGRWRELYDRALAGSPVDEEVEIRLGAVTRPYRVRALPVRAAPEDGSPDETAPILAVAVLARDASAARSSESQLRAMDRASTAGSFVRAFIHDVNNPLAILQGNLEVLAELAPEGEPDLRDALTDALEGVRRVITEVDNLRAATEPPGRQPHPVDINRALDRALRLNLSQIRHRARLVTRYGDIPPVLGHESQLIQAFAALLANAGEAITEGQPEDNEITVITDEVGGRIRVVVRDTGEGIHEAIRSRILEPFFTTRPVGTGAGLGLSIARRAIEGAGGSLRIDSEVGRGTTVTVELPPYRATPVEEAERPAPALLPRARILVIDDEPAMHTTVQRMVPQHQVEGVHNALEAIERIHRNPWYDLILCDVMMPDMPGEQVYESIATSHPGLERRFVFMTGGAFTRRAQAFLERVPNPQLRKPFQAHDIEVQLALVRHGDRRGEGA